MNADGTDVVRLTFSVHTDAVPSWSPDGMKIAFQSNRDGNDEIYVMNADGSGQTNLSNNPADDVEPSWCPDGSIVFESNRDGDYEIYRMHADGSVVVRLTVNAATDSDPECSPDGGQVAFVSDRTGDNEIYRMNSDGTGSPTRLTFSPGWDVDPSWSPDGATIAFTSRRDGNPEVYTMNAVDGSAQTNLTNNPAGDDQRPAWSPDGTQIAFWRFQNSNEEIFVMNADGSNPHDVTNNPGIDEMPDWQRPVGDNDHDWTKQDYAYLWGDGCRDDKELLLAPPTDPMNPWDFYSVPVPALIAAPTPLTDFRDSAVGAGDAQAVFAYFKAAAKEGTAVYEQDLNNNGIKDGIEYDRTVVGPGMSGPPDGVVGSADAELAFAQFKKGYHC